MSRTLLLRPKKGYLSVWLAFTLIVSSTFSAYAAKSYEVSSAQTIEFPNTTSCKDDLQTCIDQAPEGSTIHIAPGTHIVSLVLSRAVSLVGVDKETTILQALKDHRVLLVKGTAVDESVKISNLTITGGYADGKDSNDQLGGGILIQDGAAPLLQDLIVKRNFARSLGGGIAITSAGTDKLPRIVIRNSTLSDNESAGTGGGLVSNAQQTVMESTQIINNRAVSGGGVMIIGSFVMTNVQASGNFATEMGGGLYAGVSGMDGAISSLTDSQIEKNHAGYQGAGAFLYNAEINGTRFQGNVVTGTLGYVGGGGLAAANLVSLTKSIFLENEAPDGGAIASFGGTLTVNNSLFVNNQATDNTKGGAISQVNASPTTKIALTHVTIASQSKNVAAALKTGQGEIRMTNSIVTNHAIGVLVNAATANTMAGRFFEKSNLYYANDVDIEGSIMPAQRAVYLDPQFVDPVALDFHLRAESPAIDQGSAVEVTEDIDGQARPNGTAPDLGFDEVIPTPTPSPTPSPAPTETPTTPKPNDGHKSDSFVYLPLVTR